MSHLFARHWTRCNTGYVILNSQSTDGGLVNVPFDDHYLEDAQSMVSIDCELARCGGAVGIAAKVIEALVEASDGV